MDAVEIAAAAEVVAGAFHRAYEELAPRHGYDTRPESAVPWADVPAANRALMIATVSQLIHQGVIQPGATAVIAAAKAHAQSGYGQKSPLELRLEDAARNPEGGNA